MTQQIRFRVRPEDKFEDRRGFMLCFGSDQHIATWDGEKASKCSRCGTEPKQEVTDWCKSYGPAALTVGEVR